MTTTKHKAYTQSVATQLSTELNSLGNNTMSSLSAAFDNGTNKDLYADVELNLGSTSTRSAGGSVSLYLVHSLDETNYPDVVVGVTPPVAVWTLDAVTTARRLVEPGVDIPIPPSAYIKWALYNACGVALNASGNTVKIRTHSVETT